MRADRLLAFILLLQKHQRMTAQELSAELEVSVRTIYRDLEALSLAGIPVYAERGPHGGICLLEDYRTSLTGMTPAEASALSLLDIPASLAALEVGEKLRNALLKLSASLPPPRTETIQFSRKIYLDWSENAQSSPESQLLSGLYQAVIREQKVWLCYRMWNWVETEGEVEPYGLVARAGQWYLIFANAEKVIARPLSAIRNFRSLPETFQPPEDFILSVWWNIWLQHQAQDQFPFQTTVWLSNTIYQNLEAYLGESVRLISARPTSEFERTECTLAFESLTAARAQLLGLGGAVEVLTPQALRLSLADFARQALVHYPEISSF